MVPQGSFFNKSGIRINTGTVRRIKMSFNFQWSRDTSIISSSIKFNLRSKFGYAG
ncbi:hypothetical protein [Escherichia phage FL18]